MRLVYYISGHGLGHSSRSIEVMREVRARDPLAEIIVRTAAPRWIFESAAPRGIIYQHLPTDTGVVQDDSLSLDEEATARAAGRFDERFAHLVEAEAQLLRDVHPDVVIGDVPPVAGAAAHRAQLPSVVVANFTWDWILGIYPAFDRLAPGAIQTMRDAYAKTTLALRLPLHGGFSTMPAVRDVPLIARSSLRGRAETRRLLHLEEDRIVVLSSFSGFGLDLPIADLERSGDFVLLAPEKEPPAGLRYEDLVAAADVVVSKPGYGIVSECAANGTALLYSSRGNFAEYDVLVREMPTLLRCRFIPQDDLRGGRWTEHVRAVLAQPKPATRARVDGAAVAAAAILDLRA
jgi:L-arabinokinase